MSELTGRSTFDKVGFFMPFPRPWPALSALPTLIAMLCAACGPNSDRPALGDEIVIEMTGSDYHWRLRHAGFDGELNTADDVLGERNLYAPAGYPVLVFLRSEDYVYTLRVPELGVNQIAVPSLTFDVRFEAPRPGPRQYIADEMCGFQHESLLGKVIVVPPAEYAGWLRAAGTVSQPTAAMGQT
jgi:heme/copper-type cytochrome/quinol oxidase subunit 2